MLYNTYPCEGCSKKVNGRCNKVSGKGSQVGVVYRKCTGKVNARKRICVGSCIKLGKVHRKI